jgi:enediyne biosynthesis protein E4
MNTTQAVLGGVVALAIVGATLTGCQRDAPPAPAGDQKRDGPAWFEDVTDALHLNFVHDAGPAGSFFMPQAIGSGAALFDFNNDGLLDIYLLQNGGPKSNSRNRLYQQMPDRTFKEVNGSGLEIAGWNMGVAVGDVNNDGFPDVLVTQFNGVKLFLNQGDGTFSDVTEKAGLKNPAWGASAAFFDYDRDGWLDLIVVCYVGYDPTWPCTSRSGAPDYCAPATFPGRASRLFHNLGCKSGSKQARFEDVSVNSGLNAAPAPGLGVVCADFNGDGWPDIFIANDGQANHLWINQKNGTFTEEAVRRGVAYNMMGRAEAGMGIALGDVDNDGLFDLFLTHLTEEFHGLWMQGPRGLFRERTRDARLNRQQWRATGFGTIFGDFNQDGWLDIALVSGRVSRAPVNANRDLPAHWGHYAERNQLFANDGAGKFRDICGQNAPFCGTPNVARGLVYGDIDGDGALDLLVTTIAGRARIFRNVAPDRGHWLWIRAIDPAWKRDAYGAEVRVVAAGRRPWVRWLNPATSYLCSNDPRLHFGLGDAAGVDRIEVLWPDGSLEVFPGGRADRCIEVMKGQGKKKGGA